MHHSYNDYVLSENSAREAKEEDKEIVVEESQ